jgi:hypothetical protein
MPPATKICPLFNNIELCRYRLVLRLDCVVPEVTIRVAAPLVDPDVAVTVAFPVVAAVARPELLTAMTLEFDDTHVLVAVRFWVLPSV